MVLTNMSGLAHGDLPQAVTNAALGWERVSAAASFGARTAIWWAVTAPLGLLLLSYKAGRRLRRRQPLRPWLRGLSFAGVLGLVAVVPAVIIGFQALLGVSFRTGYAFFPDLTVTAVATMAFARAASGRFIDIGGSRGVICGGIPLLADSCHTADLQYNRSTDPLRSLRASVRQKFRRVLGGHSTPAM